MRACCCFLASARVLAPSCLTLLGLMLGWSAATKGMDERFARIKSDPRFVRPKKDSSKVQLDDRFRSLFSADDAAAGVFAATGFCSSCC